MLHDNAKEIILEIWMYFIPVQPFLARKREDYGREEFEAFLQQKMTKPLLQNL